MTRLRHAHVSGRYNANWRAFCRYVRDVVVRGRCTSFTTTESYGSMKVMRQVLGDQWILARRGEYVIGVRRDTYQRKPLWSYVRLSTRYDGRETWRDLFVHRRTFLHKATRRPVLFISAHAPSGVESGSNWRGGSQTDAHQAGVTKLGRAIAVARRKRKGLVVVVGIDTNLDHRSPKWRDRMTAMLGLKSMWSDRPPTRGTHGPRAIDAVYASASCRGRVSDALKPPKVDHFAVWAEIDLGEAA